MACDISPACSRNWSLMTLILLPKPTPEIQKCGYNLKTNLCILNLHFWKHLARNNIDIYGFLEICSAVYFQQSTTTEKENTGISMALPNHSMRLGQQLYYFIFEYFWHNSKRFQEGCYGIQHDSSRGINALLDSVVVQQLEWCSIIVHPLQPILPPIIVFGRRKKDSRNVGILLLTKFSDCKCIQQLAVSRIGLGWLDRQ